MNMPHLIVLHSGSNEFYINAEHISAIFPTIVKRDQRELHGSKLILATHASRFIVEESPAKIMEMLRQFNDGHQSKDNCRSKATEVPRALAKEFEKPFI